MVAYVGLKKDIKYHNGSELHYLLGKAVKRDEGIIDSSQPRLYWTDSPDDTDALKELVKEELSVLTASQPDYLIDVAPMAPGATNVGPYGAYLF